MNQENVLKPFRVSLSMRGNEKARKQFFFEKKNQKTFDCWLTWYERLIRTELIKVFWFFSSEKNCLLP
jgi:hypothetical protein